MTLFLFLLLPVILILYSLWNKNPKIIPVVFIGAISSVLLCLFKFMFSYAHRLIYLSFSTNFLFYLINKILLPVIVLYAVFFLVSRDELKFKFDSFFPLLCSFYMFYLPYTVISTSEFFYTSYDLFIKPVVYAAMLMQCGISFHYIYKNVISKKIFLVIADSLLIIAYLILPAVFDALYAIDFNYAIILLCSILFFAVPVVYAIFVFIFRLVKEKKEN